MHATIPESPRGPIITLSVRQLLDVELGLYLLTLLSDDADPSTLPDFLQSDYEGAPSLTPRQYRFLSRAKLLLAHLSNREHWQMMLTAYRESRPHRHAFDIAADGRTCTAKAVGFSRNRLSILRKMLVG
ncbi:hypothetical protein [Spirosoma sp.]|uniref:pPIWI_RE_Z domain-containing protein n=1 Tax=Spirosoma sp. TaxID=1899569 RepID=UPI0026212DCE|nr:hypothetical protein [Spirosoma sp.]MCX6217683.1 hypothetical protein [Spirosoma sp.]